MGDWWFWVGGAVILVLAGGVLEYRRRQRPLMRARAHRESVARAAIAAAEISRDAAAQADPEADELLSQAQLLLGGSRGDEAADRARGLAEQADRRWREQR